MTANRPSGSTRSYVLLFVLALAPRLALFAAGPARVPDRALHEDSWRYVLLGHELVVHATFGKPEEDGLMHQAVARLRAANGTLPPADAHGLRPESFRTPAYPAFLALAEASGGGLRAAVLVQLVLGSLLACAVVAIAKAAGAGWRGAWVAGILWAVHPGLAVYDNLILTENLFNVCCVGGLWCAARSPAAWNWLLAGLLLGLGSLVRPLGLAFLPAAVGLAWSQTPQRWYPLIALTVLSLLPGTLWAARNRAVGEGLRVTSVGDLNLLYYTAAYAISEERHEDWLRSWPQRVSELSDQLGQRLHPGEDVIAAARGLALNQLRTRPAAAARVHLKSGFKLCADHSLGLAYSLAGVPYQPSGLFSRLVLGDRSEAAGGSGAALALSLGWMLLNLGIALAAAWGLGRALHRRHWRVVIIGGVTVVLLVLATGAVGLERFRMPLMAPLLVLVAYGLTRPVLMEQPG